MQTCPQPSETKLPACIEKAAGPVLAKAKDAKASGDYYIKLHLRCGTVLPDSVKVQKLTDAV